ncbi:unnamed protein product, partial [Allacma fusca]
KSPPTEVDSDNTQGNPLPTSFGNRKTSSQQSPVSNRRHPSSSLSTQMPSQQQSAQNLFKKTSKRKTQSKKIPNAQTSTSGESESHGESNSSQASKKSEGKITQNGQQSQPMERPSIAKADSVAIAK